MNNEAPEFSDSVRNVVMTVTLISVAVAVITLIVYHWG